MATIKEIAALAGVSRGTVDRVLNNRGSVNPNTSEKIKEIAKALDYKPNRAGLVLAAQKKNLKIGVIVFADNIFFLDIIDGIKEKAAELSGYNCTVILKQVPIGVEAQLQAITELEKEDVNGIAMVPYNDDRIRKAIHELFHQGIPVVTLNTDIENSKRIAYVGSHYKKSGSTAAGLLKLITNGPVNIGIVSGSSNILCHTERILGFQEILSPFKDTITIIDIIEVHDDEIESYEKTTALLKEHPEINALYFTAGGVYGGCRSVTNLNLQDHIKIVANDLVPTTKSLVEQGIISAVICQEPKLQGSRPLDILFSYLTTGELPKNEFNYVSADIRIKENLF